MQIITDDETTVLRLAKDGAITKLSLVFSWRYMAYLYYIETNL